MKKIRVGDISSQIRGVTYNKTEASQTAKEGYLPVLRANNITEEGLDFENLVYVPKARIASKQFIRKGDIVIAASSGSIQVVGKAAYASKDFEGSFGAFCKVLRPSKEVDSKFFSFFFQTKFYRNTISNLAAGANINNLKNEHLDDLEFNLPPLAEQKRIAEMLDKADRLRQKDRQLLQKYDQLLQSVFLDMFGDPVKNEKGWERGTIRDIITEAKYGTSKPAESEGEYPYLRMNNLTYSGSMDFTDLKYINLEDKERNKYLVKKGDLLFNRTNSKELVGKTAVYRSDTEMAIAGYLIRVRTNERGNTDYISGYLNSTHGKKTLMGMCKSIVGMANINAQELQDINILIPPVKLQNQYSTIVSKVEAMKVNLMKEINASESLFQSLLQKAFKGELALKEREPAAVLEVYSGR